MSDSEDAVVRRYCAATERGDLDGMVSCFAPSAEIVSPLSNRMVFRGHDDIRLVLKAVLGSLSGIQWTHITFGDSTWVVLGQATVLGVSMTDAAVIDLDDDGLIKRFQPHQRPWLALTLLAIRTTPAFISHPGALRRALSAGARRKPR